MTSLTTIIKEEQAFIEDLLSSIPFSSNPTTYFLKIYKLSHHQLNQLNDEPFKFPIEANKLLKLCISLGSLMNTLSIDEENYKQQIAQQRQKSLMGLRPGYDANDPLNSNNSPASYTPLTAGPPHPSQQLQQPSRHVIHSSGQQPSGSHHQPSYQVRFLKSLLTILKNFDIDGPRDPIGSHQSQGRSSTMSYNRESMASYGSSSFTPKRVQSNGSFGSGINTSPIKLNSRQLLIEKLEINIKLDNLFIYKITLKLILSIYAKLSEALLQIREEEQYISAITTATTTTIPSSSSSTTTTTTTPTAASTSTSAHQDESSSIFSGESSNSSESNLSNTEYLKLLHNVLYRISQGIIQPFVTLLYVEFVETKVTEDFTQLINTL
ncbi:hypothetical protein PVL30_000134 [Lodderomyces elongisporus]|uniref:uncharacterized protein n=1 Tax=Lodderomyces elongisporus TaxID=36914 RepID=UPI00291F5735|nr:uncharacterized protein PVL30_000134 [Lodderomyces elongisporus]WLF76432.1 hypothetical protein PVL30_000134 [Lodderomyces elongisporus]